MLHVIPNLWRLSRVVSTFARTGALTKVLEEVEAPSRVAVPVKAFGALVSPFGAKGDPSLPPVARAVNALGPAYIKFGQILSTRADIIGPELARDMRHLQDRLPEFSMAEARKAIRDDLDKDADDLFEAFDPPIAAASIAQVHPAVTKDTGEKVAVKILRPDVEKQFRKDIRAFYMCAWVLEQLAPNADRLRPRAVVDHFNGVVTAEMDLRLEASAASEFYDNVAEDPAFQVPEIVWHMSGRRVMTATWMEGIPLGDQEALIAAGHDLPKLAERIIQTFLFQALRDGYWHADMHQGNLFVEDDGTIVAIDFGIMGRIDRRARQWLAEILYGLTTGNYKRVAEIHFEAQYVPSYHSVGEFATALRAVGEPMRGKPVSELSVGQMLDGLFAITRDFDMQTQPHLLLLQKTMVMVEGIATQLNPEINMWDTAAPYVRSWIRDELGPEAAIAERIKQDTDTFLRLPDLIRRIEDRFPPKGGAPEPPPLPEVELITDRKPREGGSVLGYLIAGLAGAGAMFGAIALGWIG